MSRTALREEERKEAEKHDVLYSSTKSRLQMSENAWQRFDAITDPLDYYTASLHRLGSVRGLCVLDAGCGDGWLSVILAKRGASRVDAFDISDAAIRIARERAELNGVAPLCRFVTGSFYNIPFPDNSFDAVMGQSILHHLGFKDQAAADLFRVMKPGAKAVFTEPFGNSLWLERLRLAVPVASEAPEDPDEWARQLKYSDLDAFRKLFEVEFREFELLTRLQRVIRWRPFVNALRRLDRMLLRHLPFLRPYARGILVEMRKPA